MSFTRQQSPLGLGHAVWCARDIVGNEPFAVVLPDELVLNTPGCLKQMIDAANKLGEKSNVIAVEAVPDELTHQYGICGVGKRTGNIFEVDGMVEKPPQGTAPSNLSISGRYILQPQIFDLLATQEKGAGGEIQLTDAIAALLQEKPVHAYRFRGTRFDCGTHLGLIEATISYALDNEKLSEQAAVLMRNALDELGVRNLE